MPSAKAHPAASPVGRLLAGYRPLPGVADELVGEVRDHLALGPPVGCYLADQLLLPLGISAWLPAVGGRARGGAFRTGPLSRHATTHLDVLRQFLGVRIEVAPELDGRVCLVRVSPPL